MTETTELSGRRRLRRSLLLASGPALYLLLVAVAPDTIPADARQVLGILGWMSIWWLTEAIPLGATALLPIVLFPALGVSSTRDAVSPYASDIVFLFLAGFLLAAALQHWRAHARIAYGMVAAVGTGGRRVVLGVMLATAFISLWISNTATAAMMYPIALAIGDVFGEGEDARKLRTALMLGVAYSASIGGMGTLIGTPPNLIFAEQLAGRRISFVEFMMIGLPIAAVLLPLCWAMLVFVLYRARVALGEEARAVLAERRRSLGTLCGGEKAVLTVFMLTALGWLFRERKEIGSLVIPGISDLFPAVSDASVGIAGALLLFVLTGRRGDGRREPLLTWREAKEIPWEVLLLFGGGLSLAAAMESSGLARWMGGLMTALHGYPLMLIFAGLALIVLVLSELASNTAVAAMAMPIAASLASAVGQEPMVLMLVAALAASTGFALPVATPPNAIVFGSGQITVRQMAAAGVLLDLLAIAIIVIMVTLLYPLVLG
jgi:sodium-dependent dicarboxylate transporter 2/3/5